jgi:hypothetical protein
LALVQHTSVSALMSADVFTYDTTTASGCSAFILRSPATVTMSAIGQPARFSGMSTSLSGERIEAVSAMKCTPQKRITDASVAAALRASSRESPV